MLDQMYGGGGKGGDEEKEEDSDLEDDAEMEEAVRRDADEEDGEEEGDDEVGGGIKHSDFFDGGGDTPRATLVSLVSGLLSPRQPINRPCPHAVRSCRVVLLLCYFSDKSLIYCCAWQY